MRIAKPLLMVTTPLGVCLGLIEAFRLTGGLVIVMAAMLAVLTAAAAVVVQTIRREQALVAQAAVARANDPEGTR